VQGVEVAPDGFAEPDGRVLLLSLQGAARSWTAVSGKDLFEQLGRSGGQFLTLADQAESGTVPRTRTASQGAVLFHPSLR
jgi:hypothetical protein